MVRHFTVTKKSLLRLDRKQCQDCGEGFAIDDDIVVTGKTADKETGKKSKNVRAPLRHYHAQCWELNHVLDV